MATQNLARPKDRPYRKPEKPPARVINMKLELDLVDAIEEMGKAQAYDFHRAIKNALKWAVWAHSCGRSPYTELINGEPQGFADWDAKIRARREARELTRLYELGEKP